MYQTFTFFIQGSSNIWTGFAITSKVGDNVNNRNSLSAKGNLCFHLPVYNLNEATMERFTLEGNSGHL